ncbi:MAG: type II toxin-antitoxin system PemK/MazF family toxin [Anaerolineales bacterium]|nr:MAG: type II toxin-antitoxin system PemK/MazF family toxin [Anaerolineales bacterium]
MKKGEVWIINLDPTAGAEIKKTRPCILVGNDAIGRLPLKIVVSVTDWNTAFQNAPWHVPIEKGKENGITKKSSADTFQVRSVSEGRLVKRIGVISEDVLARINEALKISLDLE